MNKPRKKPPWYTTEAFWRTFWQMVTLVGTLATIAGLIISLIK